MKKLLSVSILAMLAVVPLAANATEAYSDATIYNSGDNNDTTKVATTAYVKGAYNAANANINAERVRVDNITTAIGTQAAGNHSTLYTNDNETIHQSLEALETKIDTVSSQGSTNYVTKDSANASTYATQHNQTLQYISGVDGTKVGEGLAKLDAQVKTNADNISTNSTNIGTIGNLSNATNLASTDDTLVKGVIALDTKLGTVSAGNMGTNATTVVDAIKEIDTKVDVLSGDVNTVGSLAAEVARAEGVEGSLANLTSTEGSVLAPSTARGNLVAAINAVAAKVDTSATNANVNNGNYIGSTHDAGTVSTALTALDTRAKTNADNIATNTTNISTNTTHIGTVGSLTTTAKTDLVSAVNEVNSKVLTVYSDWASGGTASGANTVELDVPSGN